MSLENLEKPVGYFEWLVHQVGKKSWVSLMVLVDFLLIAFANPKVLPQLIVITKNEDMLQANPLPTDYWSYWLIVVTGVFLLIGIIAYITRPKTDSIGLILSAGSAIKGLMPYGFDDAVFFKQLGRSRIINDVVNGLCDSAYRFGILTGESGCGKTSFLQAGVCSGLLAQQHQALYVRCNHRQPLESICQALHEQFAIPDDQLQRLTLTPLLEFAANYLAQQDQSIKLVLILDQFEQFFIRQRDKEEQEVFVGALRQWYQHSDHPVKIMVSMRSDFLGQMFEIQNMLGMTLEPKRNFILKKFEPIEAAAVFQTIAEQEPINCASRFAEVLTTDIFLGSADSWIAPVDLQMLVWIIASGKDIKHYTMIETAVQKISGSAELRIFFLQQLLDLCQTRTRRQAALKVLVGLIDSNSNLSAGIFTETELQQRLSDCLAPDKISQALQWLTRADVRLVVPCSKGRAQGFALVHASIVPAIRHLAAPPLIRRVQANQQAQQRDLSSDHTQSFALWNSRQHINNTLSDNSSRNYRFGLFAIVGLLLIGVFAYKISLVPEVQMWRVKQTLVDLNDPSSTTNLKRQSASALVASGSLELALAIINNTENDSDKAFIIQALANRSETLQDSNRIARLLNKLFLLTESITDVHNKAESFLALAESIRILDDQSQALTLFGQLQRAATEIDNASGKAKILQALAGITTQLKDKAKAVELFEQLQIAADTIDDAKSKVKAFQVLANIADQQNHSGKVVELLGKALVASEGMDYVSTKANTYKALMKSATRLKDPDNAAGFLDELLAATQALDDVRVKAGLLQTLATSSLDLVGKNRINALLDKLQESAERISHAGYKAETLLTLATSATAIGDHDNAFVLLEKVAAIITETNDVKLKTKTLNMLVARLDTLQDPSQVSAMVDTLKLLAEGLENASVSANIFNGLALSAAEFGQLGQAVILLEQAQVTAVKITPVVAKARMLLSLVTSASELKARDKFLELLDQAVDVVGDIRNNEAQAKMLQVLARSALDFKQMDIAAQILDKWRMAVKGINDSGTQFTTYKLVAERIVELDRLDMAVALLGKFQEDVEAIRVAGFKSQLLMVVAKTTSQLNQPSRIDGLIDKAQAATEGINHAGTRIKIQQSLIESIAELNKFEKALALLGSAQRTTEAMSIGSYKVYTFINLAKTATKIQSPNKAVVLFSSALLAAEAIEESKAKANVLQALAESLGILTAPGSVAELFDKLQLVAEGIDEAMVKVKTFKTLVKVAQEHEQPDKVKDLLDKIRTNAEFIVDARFKANTFLYLAKHDAELNESAEVGLLLDLALGAVENIDKDQYKANTLIELGQTAKDLSAASEMAQWLYRLGHSASFIADSTAGDSVWVFLSEQAALLGNWTQARKFAAETTSESAEIKALSRILQTWGERNMKASRQG